MVTIEIVHTASGETSFKVDGYDLSHLIDGGSISFSGESGSRPRVTLTVDLRPHHVTETFADGRVWLLSADSATMTDSNR